MRSRYNKRKGEIYRGHYKSSRERKRLDFQKPQIAEPAGLYEREFEIENNSSSYISILENLAASNEIIFLDSNIINLELRRRTLKYNSSNLHKYSNLLGVYSSLIRFAGINHTLEPCQPVLRIMHDFILYYENFLRKPKVHITLGIGEEQLNYIMEMKRNIRNFPIKHKFDSELKEPLKKLDALISENMQKTALLGYEENSITKEIYGILYNGDLHVGVNPSEADKMFIAAACAASHIAKTDAYLLSNDRDISFSIIKSRERIKNLIASHVPKLRINVKINNIFFNGQGYDLINRTSFFS